MDKCTHSTNVRTDVSLKGGLLHFDPGFSLCLCLSNFVIDLDNNIESKFIKFLMSRS